MKGIVAASLLAIFMLVSTVSAQSNAYPVFDEERLTARALTLLYNYPLSRDFNGGGARAKGMGSAYLGVADDISAVTWNPAGLYRQDDQYSQPVMGVGYKSISSDATFRDKMYLNVPWYEHTVNNSANGTDFLALVVPLRIKGHQFIGSMAYSRLGDEFYNSAMSLDVTMPFNREDTLNNIYRPFGYRNNVTYRSWVNAYNFGFGTRIYRQLSFGLSVNAYGGGAAQRVNEVAFWDGLEVVGLEGSQRAYVQVLNDVVDTTSYSGVYFVLGFKYSGSRLSAGLVFKTPHVLKETTDYLTAHVIKANGLELSNSSVIIHNDDQLIEIDQPLIVGAGVGYKLRENWLWAADIEYRAFGGSMLNRRDSLQLVPGGTDIEYFTEIDPQWNNAVTMRLGTEYVWQTGKALIPVMPLRAGFGWIQVPEPDVVSGDFYLNGTLPIVENPQYETASMIRFTLGTGIHWSQVHLDFAFESYSLDRQNAALVRESSVDNNAFDVTFTGFF